MIYIIIALSILLIISAILGVSTYVLLHATMHYMACRGYRIPTHDDIDAGVKYVLSHWREII